MRKWFLAPVLVAAAAAGALAFSAEESDKSETFRQLELFGDILARVQSDYVTETDDPELIENAINGMLRSLDPHSSYLPPDAFRDMQVQTSGEYGGLGIEVTLESGVVKVVAPFDDTPASRAGVEPGDYLTAIDGESIVGTTLDEAVEQMRGQVGEPITITIARENEDPFDVELVRETIEVKPIAWRVEDGFGVIRVSTFNEKTTDSLAAAVKSLQAELGPNLPGLVLDLRSNPGGLLDEAVGVSGVFLNGGEVVSTRGRDPRDTERYNADGGDMTDGSPIVVLIDSGTASAAEIVAGALQDRERATVAGMTSFGKGSVQTVIPLRGGRDGAIRLTTQRYYTPSGRSIQATGIVPDHEIANEILDESALKRLRESDLPNALKAELESMAENEEVEHNIEEPPADYEGEDFQLQRGLEILAELNASQKTAAVAQ